MRKGTAQLLFYLIAATLIFGFPKAMAAGLGDQANPDPGSGGMVTYEDYIGKRFAVMTGSTYDEVASRVFHASEKLYFSNTVEEIEAVKLGKADAALISDVIAAISLNSGPYEDLQVLPIPMEELYYDYGVFSIQEDIIHQYNQFLEQIKKDGTLEEMQERWLTGNAFEAVMPEIPLTGENGTLTAAVAATYPPFVFAGNAGELSGFDIEQLRRFAAWLGKDIRFSEMDFGAVMSYIASGKADIGGSIYATEERKKSFIFGNPDYVTKAVLVVKRPDLETESTQRSYTWFIGKTVGTGIGAASDTVLETLGAIPAYYPDIPTGVEDVRNGRIAGFTTDLSALTVMAYEKGNEGMEVIEVPASFFLAPQGTFASYDRPDLIEEFNAFLAVIKADGTLDQMKEHWFVGVPDLNEPMPQLTYTGEKGVLNVATTGTIVPFDYFGENGELKGYSIELMNRFAAHAGYIIKYYPMEFGALIPAVLGGKADMAISNISITEERKKSVLFSDSIFEDQLGIITLKVPEAGAAADEIKSGEKVTGAGEWLKTAIQRNLIQDDRWRMILDGLGVTVLISLLAQAMGTILGGVLCYILMCRIKWLSRLGHFFCSLIQGLPVVVLLMISYYIIFGRSDVPAILIAVCAFAVVESVAIASNLKGAIDTVDTVEIEAARSLGFTAFGAFVNVTLPRAVRRALPAYCSGFVGLVKATAIVGYIAIQDLTRAGDIIRSRTYDAFFPLLFVALVYLLVTSLCVWLLKKLVKRINREVGK